MLSFGIGFLLVGAILVIDAFLRFLVPNSVSDSTWIRLFEGAVGGLFAAAGVWNFTQL